MVRAWFSFAPIPVRRSSLREWWFGSTTFGSTSRLTPSRSVVTVSSPRSKPRSLRRRMRSSMRQRSLTLNSSTRVSSVHSPS